MPYSATLAALLSAILVAAAPALSFASPPKEPLEIGREPQFVFDNYVVDNHWAIKYKRQAVRRVFHPAKKYGGNPILNGDQPSFLWVVRDGKSGAFRMWYQVNLRLKEPKPKGGAFRAYIAYAQSEDGLNWQKPELALAPWLDIRPNNIVLARPENPKSEASAPCILELPEKDRRGYRFVMLYRNKGAGGGDVNGIRLVGSQDGVHWNAESDTRIAHLHSDTHNTISFDPRRGEYVMFCRPKHIYRTFRGEMIDTGASRRVARMTSRELWTDWMKQGEPQTILTPDEVDQEKHFNFFYGMPTRYFGGVYWGFLEPFRMNDFIHTELAVSRDGVNFLRPVGRPKLIELGEDGAWDDTMIFASPSWVEVADEWWIYYSGWDGPHGTAERTGAVGLAKIRKEGFVSVRGPRDGGVVCTRRIRWPGGKLFINADASAGEVQVRLSDEKRRPLPGFEYADCRPIRGDAVEHAVEWKKRSIDELKGRVIRLEFFLKDADLYTFRAKGESE